MSARMFGLIAGLACVLTLSLSAQEAQNLHPTFKRVQSGIAAVSSIGMVPPIYEKYWADAKRCGRVSKGDLSSWKMYTVEGQGFMIEDGTDVFNGVTFFERRKIYVRLDMWLDPRLVTHEMLHAVLYDNDKPHQHHEKYDKSFSKADSLFIKCDLGAPPLMRPPS